MRTIKNPDGDFVRQMKKELKANNGYCPSAMEWNNDTRCPCRDFRETDEPGPCNCGLYIKVKENADG